MRYVFHYVNFVVIFLPYSSSLALAVAECNTSALSIRDTSSKASYQDIRQRLTFALPLTDQQVTHLSDISCKSLKKYTVNAETGCLILKVNTVILCRQVSFTATLTKASPPPQSDVWRSYGKRSLSG